MVISSRTPEGEANRCRVCGCAAVVKPSEPARDAPCPRCGSLMWFGPAPAAQAGPPVKIEEPEAARLEALGALYARATVWLGPPSPEHLTAVEASEPAALADLTARAVTAASWDELLGLVSGQAAR